MKGLYFGFGSPQQQSCMQGQKTLSLSYTMHTFFTLLAQRLPNDSLNDSFFQTPHLRDANLRWLVDLSHFHFIMPVMQCLIKQHLWAQCCFVYSVTGETYFTAPKAAPSGKEWISFFIQTNGEKTNKWAGDMLMMKRLGIRFKNDLFQWFRVDSFLWETITSHTVHF